MDLSTSSVYAGMAPDQTPHKLAYVEKESPIEITADPSDTFLVAAAKNGDHQAHAELCRRHSKHILRTVLWIARNLANAEDTLQEAFLKAYVHIGRFEGRSAFASWLTRIAINSALMLSRKNHSRCEYSLEGGVDGDDFKLLEPTATAHNAEEACIVTALENECIRAIRYLSPTLRVVVQIRYREDASVARLAARRADGDAQLAQYQQSVLLALEDLENALVRYARSQDRDAQLQLAAKDSKRAGDLAIRFRDGATGLLDLLDAQSAQLKDDDAYAESHSNIARALSPLFCCTSRLLGDSLNGLLKHRKA
jgi:RNA polymerase sigma factor (sigma-70 family)